MCQKFIFILLLICQISFSQFVKKETIILPKTKSGGVNQGFYKIQSDSLITSAAFKIKNNSNFNNSYIITPEDTFYLSRNIDEDDGLLVASNLIIFPKPVNIFYLYTSMVKDSIQVFLINDKTNIKKSAIKVSDKKKIPVLKCRRW